VVEQDGSAEVAVPAAVAVAIEARAGDLAEWLADATAFEAAGAQALWVTSAPDRELDPLVLTAALAVVTARALLLVSLPAPARPDALITAGRLSRGRLRIVVTADAAASPDDAVMRTGGFGLVHRSAAEPEVLRADEPRDGPQGEPRDEPRDWLLVTAPENRAAWRVTVADALERGHNRLMVPANPRLLDILRNPDEPDDRRDLLLAQG
jgi:hypothetical protein